MKMTHISKIQANLKGRRVIHARKGAGQLLDGSYRSVFKGRSMNFDELREYVQGDDSKDIDWKASARSQKMLVRQYIAEKKHNILLVFDTNRRMLAHSSGLEEKRELALLSAGTMAYFAEKNGDYVGALYGTGTSFRYFPFRSGLGNIEMILESYERDVTKDNRSDLNDALDYIVRNFKRSMIILIVSDIKGLRGLTDAGLKQLGVNHDVLCLNISDAAPGGGQVFLTEQERYLPSYFSKNRRFVKRAEEKALSLQKENEERLEEYGIPCSTIDFENELDREIVALLDKHRLMSAAGR